MRVIETFHNACAKYQSDARAEEDDYHLLGACLQEGCGPFPGYPISSPEEMVKHHAEIHGTDTERSGLRDCKCKAFRRSDVDRAARGSNMPWLHVRAEEVADGSGTPRLRLRPAKKRTESKRGGAPQVETAKDAVAQEEGDPQTASKPVKRKKRRSASGGRMPKGKKF